jgi:hypothetical protein
MQVELHYSLFTSTYIPGETYTGGILFKMLVLGINADRNLNTSFFYSYIVKQDDQQANTFRLLE